MKTKHIHINTRDEMISAIRDFTVAADLKRCMLQSAEAGLRPVKISVNGDKGSGKSLVLDTIFAQLGDGEVRQPSLRFMSNVGLDLEGKKLKINFMNSNHDDCNNFFYSGVYIAFDAIDTLRKGVRTTALSIVQNRPKGRFNLTALFTKIGLIQEPDFHINVQFTEPKTKGQTFRPRVISFSHAEHNGPDEITMA